MASGTKKRRKSQSPARSATSKRARVTSKRTQHDEPDPHSSRAGSVKDTHLVQKQSQSTSLPTGEDWIFRVKVISSATDLGNEVFKNAVQGLVRICFPDGILDQLGSQILGQHMREEKAPEGNILRMEEVFQSEMTQRIASMLAEHLDTATKIGLVLKTILRTTARVHGGDIGDDILGHVTASLLKLKASASEHSKEWLARGDGAQEEDNSDGNTSTSGVSDEEPAPPPKSMEKKKRDGQSERKYTSAKSHVAKLTSTHTSLPAASLQKRTPEDRDRIISLKWHGDVNAKELSSAAIARIFSRTSDLFAYHALPIAQRSLGPNASKKEIRCEMQSLLDGTPPEEYEKWFDSLQKLLGGDRDMLERQELPSSDHQQPSSRVTPAPINTRRQAQESTRKISGNLTHSEIDPWNENRHSHQHTFDPKSGDRPLHQDPFIKREADAEHMDQPETFDEGCRKNLLSEATATSQRVSVEDLHIQSPKQVAETMDDQGSWSHGIMLDQVPSFEKEIPMTILLWGRGNIYPSQCEHVTETIMANMNRRISVEYLRSAEADGLPKAMTKTHLRATIAGTLPQPGQTFSFMNTLKVIEQSLLPWLIAMPSAFPELQAMPCVFINMMTYVSVTQNLLLGSWSAISRKTGPQVWSLLSEALQRRGISETLATASFVNFMRIDKLCNSSDPDITKRLAFERILRHLVFFNREKFPELKATSVVTTWEKKTGLRW